MRGLLQNEFYSMKRVILLYAAVLVIYYILGIFGSGLLGIQLFAEFFSAMLVIYSFSYGEKSGWNVYVNALPVTKGQIVGSKYLFSLAAVSVTALCGLLLQVGSNIRQGSAPADGIWISFLMLAGAAAFLSLVLPVLFWMGAEKGRILLILIFLIPFATALAVEKLGITLELPAGRLEDLALPACAAAAVLMAVSYRISTVIYDRKEF